jgi:uncharacterized protein YhbP (UPF0306 family)
LPVERSQRSLAPARIKRVAGDLLDSSALCAIATVSPHGRAYINTAYFAWSAELDLVWMSAPDARHSRNLSANPTAAVAVYDSNQMWGNPDRGIQLFGSAREVAGRAARSAEQVYTRRFPPSADTDLSAYSFYRFRARRIKLFDESELGPGVFVTASVGSGRQVAWERTDTYGVAQDRRRPKRG